MSSEGTGHLTRHPRLRWQTRHSGRQTRDNHMIVRVLPLAVVTFILACLPPRPARFAMRISITPWTFPVRYDWSCPWVLVKCRDLFACFDFGILFLHPSD